MRLFEKAGRPDLAAEVEGALKEILQDFEEESSSAG